MESSVYLLFHIRPNGQLLLLGAYRSEQEAKSAINRLKDKPGFADYPDGFEYHSYELGVDVEEWKNGFVDDDSDESDEEAPKDSADPAERPN
jgi:hypothetical protein